jgi:hypothetical protein
MRGIRVVVAILAWAACLNILGSAALAWEFEVKGSIRWTYERCDLTGNTDFFGPFNVDNGAGTLVANLNHWAGGRFGTNLVTGSDAGWSYLTIKFDPQVQINKAIRLKGRVRLGSYGLPISSDYHTLDSVGTDNALSDAQVSMLWLTTNTPWGVFGLGKRAWQWGTALQYDGSDSLTTESLSLVAPWGPLDIGIGVYPYRFAGRSDIPAYFFFDPYDLPLYPMTGGPAQRGMYFSLADRSGQFLKEFLTFVVYSNGPIQAGILGSFSSFHIGPEALLTDSANRPVNRLVPLDTDYRHGSLFVKYNDGRFFFNAEGAWLYWTDRFGADPGNVVGQPNTRYIEQWRYAAELGFMAGPLKLSFLNARTPGPDRRNGNFIDRQSAAFVWHPSFDIFLANFSLFRPYSYLFGYIFGSGLNAYNLSRNGYIRDAFVLATRADYAIAANLNAYATFLWAERTAKGYSWGAIGPNETLFTGVPADGFLNFSINRYPNAPNIPDTGLGYEITAGIDWKILEGLTTGFLAAYWKPGKWFSYACIDRSVPGWNNGTAANNFGTRPDKTIDPFIGGEVYFLYEF